MSKKKISVGIAKAKEDVFSLLKNDFLQVDSETPTLKEEMSPPFSYKSLENLPDISPTLKAAVDSISTNVSGFGYELKPLIDAVKKQDGYYKRSTGERVPDEIIEEMKEEEQFLNMFFESISLDCSFTELGKIKEYNRQVFGNSFWEWLRDGDGNLVGVNHVDTKTVRLLKKDKTATKFSQFVRNPNNFEYEEITRLKRFRRYVQTVNNKKTYFKEFGDPRQLNAKTGEYLNLSQDQIAEKGIVLATELMHFKIYHTGSEYGVPTYISCTPHILAVRAAGLVNFSLLQNNAIPPVAVIVEGYQDDQLETKLKEYIESSVKGVNSFSSMLIIQAEAQTGSQLAGPGVQPIKPSIRFEPLSQLLTRDGMFLEFIKQTDEKIVGVFRLANQFVGLSKDLNRATAQVAQELVEQQVFTPLRVEFDFIINSKVLNDLRIKYWSFQSLSVRIDDSETRANIVKTLTDSGGLVGRDVRKEASGILNVKLDDLDGSFMDLPQGIAQELLRQTGSIEAPEKSLVSQDSFQSSEVLEDQETGSLSEESSEKRLQELDEISLKVIENLLGIREDLEVKKAYLYYDPQKVEAQ